MKNKLIDLIVALGNEEIKIKKMEYLPSSYLSVECYSGKNEIEFGVNIDGDGNFEITDYENCNEYEATCVHCAVERIKQIIEEHYIPEVESTPVGYLMGIPVYMQSKRFSETVFISNDDLKMW